MSNFKCPHCGTLILEGEDGNYITGCEHYPMEQVKRDRKKEQDIEQGINEILQRPFSWARFKVINK